MLGQFLNINTASSSGSLPSNTIPNPKGKIKVITTRSGLAYDGPPAPPTPSTSSKEVEQEPEILMDQLPKPREITFKVISKDSKSIPPLVVQSSYEPVEPARAPNSFEPSSAHNDDSFKELHKFLEMFKKLHFNISLAEALILMPKYTKMMKDLLLNKEKLLEVANTPLIENCSTVIMKKLPEKLGDPGRFLISCDFTKMPQCMALADLGASINLMPLGIYQKLKLPELVPTKMSLELANGSLAYPTGIAEDMLVKVGQFSFSADFVIVDYEVNYRVPLILGRPFLRTARVLIDVYGEELILRDDGERLVLKLDGRHDKESVNMISIRDFSYDNPIRRVFHQPSGSPTLTSEPLLKFSSPSLSPSEGSDMLLGETNSLDPHNDNSLKLKAFCCDTEEINSGSTTSLTDASPSSHLLETIIYDTYDDLDSKEEKIKESKLLIDYLDDLDSFESSDFLPFPKYDSFFHEDFSEVDALPSTVIEDKVFNPSILIYENLNVTKDKSSKEMFSSKSLDVFDPFAPPLMDHDFTLVIPGISPQFLKSLVFGVLSRFTRASQPLHAFSLGKSNIL
ncbi:reverse transcriptase domain-containing protein [Tanacetum coccineum]